MSDDPLHILLVDDDEDHIELIRRAFISESKTFNFIPASTLAEARQVLKKSTPDLMIVDFRLPDGKGMELLKANCPNSYPDWSWK
jgi:response regulator of citrate/malate metabolism